MRSWIDLTPFCDELERESSFAPLRCANGYTKCLCESNCAGEWFSRSWVDKRCMRREEEAEVRRGLKVMSGVGSASAVSEELHLNKIGGGETVRW